ncbi:MAG: flagellar basal body-associated FliL family protein [Alphaproteobacteria bacterium]|nr:flagellar basal body-associated FliL family protein [Alphaproteobacteria bacterium]
MTAKTDRKDVPPEDAAPRRRMTLLAAVCASLFLALAVGGYYGYHAIHMRKLKPVALPANGYATDMAYYDLPSMTVSLGSGAGNMPPRLRADMSLEMARKDLPSIQGYEPHIVEKLNAFLANVSPEDLRDATSLPWLRSEMLQVVNQGAPAPIHAILFRELVFM